MEQHLVQAPQLAQAHQNYGQSYNANYYPKYQQKSQLNQEMQLQNVNFDNDFNCTENCEGNSISTTKGGNKLSAPVMPVLNEVWPLMNLG
jgi:hypothetical protein